jgi:hypothetical protein
MSILLNTDFTGKYHIALTKFNDNDIDAYIEKYEKKYLMKLLGVELYNLFIDELDLNNPPVNPIYKVIFDPLSFDDGCDIVVSNGMKEMLKGFIYFHWVFDEQQQQTPIGTTKQSSENSQVLNITGLSVTRFNEGVETYKAIQRYIELNQSDYIAFNGQYLGYEYIL